MNAGRKASCIGENVTYICNITTINHVWNGPGMVIDRTLGPGNLRRPVIEEGYTFRVVSVDGNNNIRSSLSLNSSVGLNGTSISCIDGIKPNRTIQMVAMVLGEYIF